MNRREFLAAGAATTSMAITARSYGQILGANDRVGLGIIGVGRRGLAVGGGFLADKRTRLTAIADTYDVTRQHVLAQQLSSVSPEPAAYNAYEDLLARKDVDAVLISTPDHLHVTIARAALAADKHVYVEKPTLHRWHEKAELVAAAQKSKRVLQCGMQQRSGAHYRAAKESFFDNKRLGDVVLVRAVWHDFSWQRRNIADAPKPPGLDWERFLGPAPHVPYEKVRYDSWRYFHDYGNGLLADILTHWVDVAQWMLNDAAPQSAYATGVLFEGTEGRLQLARDGYIFTPRTGDATRVDTTENLERAHTRNFLDAITQGTQPNAPLEAGVAASVPVLMAVKAYWSKAVVTSLDESA